MYCWKCNSKLEFSEKKISFRAECPKCSADVHVCKNCRFYSLGKPNDCLIPDIDKVVDKEKNNYCEEFSMREKLKTKESSTAKSPLGEIPPKKSFDSLF
jgi:predicted RNA-binding Zn-ribbon protein involved in translation (DUF1610 family)